jgi:UrcA family protein
MFRLLLTGVLTVGAFLAAAPASAASVYMYGESGRNAVTLKYADSDIRTVQGAKALALRVRVAAAQVCGGDELPIVRTGDQFTWCRDAAINRAIAGIDAPLLADALGRAPRILASVRPEP